MMRLLLLAHAGATLPMVGLIWFVQLVHYPLFTEVGRHDFPSFARSHQRRTAKIVAPLMLSEAALTLLLAVRPPAALPSWPPWLGVFLLATIWASTLGLQMPLHARLLVSYDPLAVRSLVRTNWIRTLLWTARGLLALWLLWAT
jgi:hypothetical protein